MQQPTTKKIPLTAETNSQNASYTISSLTQLLEFLCFSKEDIASFITHHNYNKNFQLRVPLRYAEKISKNNWQDPLLLQVLPKADELIKKTNYIKDPLQEANANPIPGLIHKYTSRILITSTSACTIHCRYCFRQHFDYKNNKLSTKNWFAILDYVSNTPSINEVIFSGGDPLALTPTQLMNKIAAIEAIPHIKTIRLHSRHAMIAPDYFTDSLINELSNSRCNIVLVTHCNHPQEISEYEQIKFLNLKKNNITLLNQSVLLHNINNNVDTLVELSNKLFDCGILPYYLHILDKVEGVSHFEVSTESINQLYNDMLTKLPGFLMPKFVLEQPGKSSKTPWHLVDSY